jgi:flavin-dependent dehydrogenase
MKIAVVGIGVAGAYLMNVLSQHHDYHVTGFERMTEENHDAVCAWATSENPMSKLVAKCGLKFDDYVLHEGKRMEVDMDENGVISHGHRKHISLRLNGMVSYDKLKLIRDMIQGTNVKYGTAPDKQLLEQNFDVIVDSTGFHRNYLPRPNYQMWIPCVQYTVKYEIGMAPYDDFYLKTFPSMTGYFWYFPLDNGYAHIGAGDFRRLNSNRFVDEFLHKYKCEIIKKVGRPVRISPPRDSEPFTDGRKTIGVGESIGTVYPLLGEGIIPSTWCAELFAHHVGDFSQYREAVLKKFEIYSLVFKFIQMKMLGTFRFFKNPLQLLRIYNHMKREEVRYGMKVRILDLIQVAKI